MYIVTWWEGEVRQAVARKDAQSAQEAAVVLRKHSDRYKERSLVPIRVMSHDTYERMKAMEKVHDATKCRHGLLRLCLTCLASKLL